MCAYTKLCVLNSREKPAMKNVVGEVPGWCHAASINKRLSPPTTHTRTHTDLCGEGGHKARYPNGGLPGEMGLGWLGVGVATTAGSVACVGPERISRRAARQRPAAPPARAPSCAKIVSSSGGR